MKQVISIFKALLWAAILVGVTMAANAQTCSYNQVVKTDRSEVFPTFDCDATLEFDTTSVIHYEFGKETVYYHMSDVYDTVYTEPVIISKYKRNGGIVYDTAYHFVACIKLIRSTSDTSTIERKYLILDYINGSLCPNLIVFTDYGGYVEWMSMSDKNKALVQVCTNYYTDLYYRAYETSEEKREKQKK